MEAGETYGSYTLIERIGAGGMAEVFLAHSVDERLRGRPVVVKRMLAQLTSNEEHVAMFLDEARLGALLKHDNIVDVLDVGKIDGSWYMALGYVDGPDLGRVLKVAHETNELLPATLAAWIIARAAEGLHFAHTVEDPESGAPLNIVHRDVSPQNILVARDGAVCVADFGVAASDQQIDETKTGLVKGKIGYMSPEQMSALPLDPRTDVLALGVSLWEALTHRRLYAGLTEVAMMMRICTETPPPPSSTGIYVDPDLEAIIARALARNRYERFGSAQDLQFALDAWAGRQARPPSTSQLAEWMTARFAPRSVLGGIATGASLIPLDATASVDVADLPTRADIQPSTPSGEASDAGPDDPTTVFDAFNEPSSPSRPRLALPKKPRPLQRGGPKKAATRQLVLYIEDEQQNWEVAQLLLQKKFDLLHAADDQQACELLRTRGAELSAVLMDIQLKGSALDGIALTRLIRGALPPNLCPAYALAVPPLSIPVFFVTAYSARYSEGELLALGGDKLVTKPVDFPQLIMALTSVQLRSAGSG